MCTIIRLIQSKISAKIYSIFRTGDLSEFRYYEWIEIDRIIKRCNESDFNEKEINIDINSVSSTIEDNGSNSFEICRKYNSSFRQLVWKTLEIASSNQDETTSNNQDLQ